MVSGSGCKFSVNFFRPNDGQTLWSADWDCWVPRQWSLSYKEGVVWQIGGMSDGVFTFAHAAILQKFGLEEWRYEFPAEKVRFMSPFQLLGERRKKEAAHLLEVLEVFSDTVVAGSPDRAEDYA